jgi:hypothetical protein
MLFLDEYYHAINDEIAMEYELNIKYMIDIVNSALININRLPLSSNEDFFIDAHGNYEHYVKYTLKKNYCIGFDLILVNDYLQLDIDRVSEAYVWSIEQVRNEKNKIIEFLEALFTSTIKVEYCGSNYTKLYMINSEGNCIKTLKVTGLTYLKVNCTTKEYPPIYRNSLDSKKNKVE